MFGLPVHFMTLKLFSQSSPRDGNPAILIVVASLAAEGTPRLALELSRVWKKAGLRPIVIVMHETPDDLAPDFDAAGIEYLDLRLPERGYRRYLVLACRISTIAREHRASALLSMPLGWHTFMAIGARIAGVRYVIAHVGNYPNSSVARTFSKFRFLVQLGRPLTDRLVCCSRYVQEGAVHRFGLNEIETIVIYNGLPLDLFANCKTSQDTVDAPFIIGMVGRLEQHKDQPTLIRAARILKTRGRNIRVWLIGEGSRHKEFEHLITTEGVSDVVSLMGMRRDVAELVTKMHVFAFSTTPDEGLGIALLEAMAAGIPVIASDVGACREVLDQGELGQLVEPGDPLALADAIDAICLDPETARQQATNARKKACQTFSIEDMAHQYAALFDVEMPLPRPSEVATARAPA